MMEKVLTKSMKQAIDYGHEYVTIEHIALVLLHEKEIQEIFKNLDIDIELCIKDITDYLDDSEYNNLKHPVAVQAIRKKTVAASTCFPKSICPKYI